MKLNFDAKHYEYKNRTGNLKAEAVGVVKGEKHFPIFEGNQIFKPLTKSKPFSTPLFAYAEVFWSSLINEYFMPAPQYQLAFCDGYEAENEKYYDYGTVVPIIYGEGEQLVNLLEFFRKHPDEKVEIDNYVNYCQMFYNYTIIFESNYFKTHRELAEQLAMQVLISILKGDQNYHYENVAFLCKASGEIIKLAPMIDHEFSTYFMLPDRMADHIHCFEELQRSIEGKEVRPDEYEYLKNETERKLMEKSAVCLHENLMYIKKHYPDVTKTFLDRIAKLDKDLREKPESFYLEKSPGYPDEANSYGFYIGKARYKEKDEEKAKEYEQKYAGKEKKIKFDFVNQQMVYELKKVIQQLTEMLE